MLSLVYFIYIGLLIIFSGKSQEMLVYRRCLYCVGGEAGVRFVGQLHTEPKSESHEDYLAAVQGAKLQLKHLFRKYAEHGFLSIL